MVLMKISELLIKFWEIGNAHLECAAEAKSPKLRAMHFGYVGRLMAMAKSMGVR